MILLQSLLLLGLFTLPGLAILLAAGPAFRTRLTVAEGLFTALLLSTALVGWLALLLAELALFSLPLLLALVVLPTAGLLGLTVRRHGRPTLTLLRQREELLLPALLLLLILLAPRSFEYLIGGRDHGVYFNTGVHIARSGQLLVDDPVIGEVPADVRPLLTRPETRPWQPGFPGPWSEGIRLTGLTIRDVDAGIYLPHGFHFYPALLAVFFAVGGLPLLFASTQLIALAGVAGFLLLLRRLWGTPSMAVGGLLLVISVTQTWYARYPSAEILIQFFFWGGVLLTTWLLERESRPLALAAGALFGLLHLVKMDTILLPLGLLAFFGALRWRGQWRADYSWFWGGYLLLSLHAILHAFFFATIYALDQLLRELLPRAIAEQLMPVASQGTYPGEILGLLLREFGWPAAGATLGAGVALWLGWWVLPRHVHRLPRRRLPGARWWLAGAGAGVALTALLVTTAAVVVEEPPEGLATLLFTGRLARLYLTRAGLAAGVAGLVLMILSSRTPAHGFTLLLAGVNMFPLFFIGSGTALDHFWVIRRYIPIAYPLLLAGAGLLVWTLVRQLQARRPLLLLPLGLWLLIAAGLLQHTLPLVGAADYDGLGEQLAAAAEQFPEDAVLLMPFPQQGVRYDLPLWLAFDRPVFAIPAATVADPRLAAAVAAWQANGRPVYWLLSDSTPPAWAAEASTWQQAIHIDTPLVETPRGRIPRESGRFRVQFDIYALGPPPAGP